MNDIKHDIKNDIRTCQSSDTSQLAFSDNIIRGNNAEPSVFFERRTMDQFLDSLFTATSATCVTGLVVFDTFRHWSIIGQLVILVLIQIGGMGFISIGVAFSMLLHKKSDSDRGI